METAAAYFQLVLRKLKNTGFLLESDPKLPSVCTLITGTPLRGSWWSHPLAQTIFQVNERLEDHKDVLITKLVSGKVTFIHRKLWPETIAIGESQEPWQLNKLPEPARSLFKQIEATGSVTTEQLAWPRNQKMKLGDAARSLEKRLLVVGTQFHSESGAHAKLLETWGRWAERIKFEAASISAAEAKKELERRLDNLNAEFHGAAKFPWQ